MTRILDFTLWLVFQDGFEFCFYLVLSFQMDGIVVLLVSYLKMTWNFVFLPCLLPQEEYHLLAQEDLHTPKVHLLLAQESQTTFRPKCPNSRNIPAQATKTKKYA